MLNLQRPLTRRQLLKRAGVLAVGTVVIGSGWEYTTGIEPDWLDIQPLTLTLPGWSRRSTVIESCSSAISI